MAEPTLKTYYVTKYALTRGILEVQGHLSEPNRDMLVWFPHSGIGGHREYAHGQDFHPTLFSARSRAEEMRIAKVKALRRQLDRLSNLHVGSLEPKKA